MTDKQTPPDWVLIEAAKRSEAHGSTSYGQKVIYERNPMFRALCDMIERYETEPVDQMDEALALQLEAFCPNDLRCYEGRNPVKLFRDGLARRGIELRKMESTSALCDLIERYETAPVDRKVLCVQEARKRTVWGVEGAGENYALLAIELWIEGYGE